MAEITLNENQRIFHIASPEGPSRPAVPKQSPAPRPQRPALILEKNTDITELEKVPAYVRRQAALTPPAGSCHKEIPEAASKIVTVNNTHRLSATNSFLYQTQD
jgi:hypothetical protein